VNVEVVQVIVNGVSKVVAVVTVEGISRKVVHIVVVIVVGCQANVAIVPALIIVALIVVVVVVIKGRILVIIAVAEWGVDTKRLLLYR